MRKSLLCFSGLLLSVLLISCGSLEKTTLEVAEPAAVEDGLAGLWQCGLAAKENWLPLDPQVIIDPDGAFRCRNRVLPPPESGEVTASSGFILVTISGGSWRQEGDKVILSSTLDKDLVYTLSPDRKTMSLDQPGPPWQLRRYASP